MRTVPSASVRSLHLEPHVAIGDRDEIAPQAPGAAAVAAAHLQRVAKPARGDDADFRPAPFQQRVGADRGAMHDRLHARRAAQRRSPLRNPSASSPRRDGTFARAERAASGIQQEQVGERAADIDPDNDATHAHEYRFLRSTGVRSVRPREGEGDREAAGWDEAP